MTDLLFNNQANHEFEILNMRRTVDITRINPSCFIPFHKLILDSFSLKEYTVLSRLVRSSRLVRLPV